MMAKDIIISLIIITRNRKDELLKSIKSCFNITKQNAELIIVDNGSTDGTIEMLDTLTVPNNFVLSLVQAKTNLGVAGGRNEGVRRASGEFLFFLDDDAYFNDSSESLDKLIAYMCKNPLISIAAVNIYDSCHKEYQNFTNFRPEIHTEPRDNFRFIGAAHMIRKSKILRETLYPEKLMYGSEESYAAMLAHSYGQKIVFYPGVKVTHSPSKKTRDSEETNQENIMTNLFVVKWLLLPISFRWISYCLFIMRIMRLKQANIGEVIKCIKIAKRRCVENIDSRKNIGIAGTVKLIRRFGILLIL
ncbi:MAG: glycosyltransferase family 2 protein [Faecalibacterium sp.]